MLNRKLIFFFLFFLFSISNLKAEDNIVFIDINFIFNESLFGKDFNKKLDENSSKLNLKIKDFKIEIDNKKKDLLNKKNLLSEIEYNQKIKDLEENIQQYNLAINTEKDKLEKYKVKIRQEFFQHLLPLLEKYSNENSISLILKKDSILLGKNSIDITDEIVKIFNEKKYKITPE